MVLIFCPQTDQNIQSVDILAAWHASQLTSVVGARKKTSLPPALSLNRVGSLPVSSAAPILLLLPRVEERRKDLWRSAKARPAVLVDVGVPSSPLVSSVVPVVT